MTTKSSQLWADITASLFSQIDDEFLSTFRAPGGANRRLAAWDPFDKSMRYYKFLLFNIARRKPREFFDAYRRVGNTGTGSPVTVAVADCQVDIDYLFAVEEFLFLRDHLDLSAVSKIVEVGAGFGRTCHAILSLADSIREYTIVDLPEVLKLSQAYLRRAAPDRFDRVRFIANDDVAAWRGVRSDLVINIDSFQEMPPDVIDEYMDGIVSGASAFYCKNPIGKYEPQCVGLPELSADQLLDVYSLGYSRTILDLFDERDLAAARDTYLSAYRPKAGANWQLVADEPMNMFPYVHHALYAVRHSRSSSNATT